MEEKLTFVDWAMIVIAAISAGLCALMIGTHPIFFFLTPIAPIVVMCAFDVFRKNENRILFGD